MWKLKRVTVWESAKEIDHARLYVIFFVSKTSKRYRNTGIYGYEDVSTEIMEVRKLLWEKVLEYRRQGKYAFLNYRKIVVRDNS